MINWLVHLWTSSFVKITAIADKKILVSFDFGGYFFMTVVLLVILGAVLGSLGTLGVLRMVKVIK